MSGVNFVDIAGLMSVCLVILPTHDTWVSGGIGDLADLCLCVECDVLWHGYRRDGATERIQLCLKGLYLPNRVHSTCRGRGRAVVAVRAILV